MRDVRAFVLTAALALAAAAPPALAEPAPDKDDAARQAVQDRVAALIGAGKCAEAQDAATAAGEARMAQQAAEVCGMKPSSSPGDRKSGGGRGGGGRGGGRGGGSGGGSGGAGGPGSGGL